MHQIKKFILAIFAIFLSIFVVFLIAEGVLQLTRYKYKILPPLEPKGYLVNDSSAGFDIAQNYPTSSLNFYDSHLDVWSNELGCFDYPYDEKSEYIYLTGDSFAWGWTHLPLKWGKQAENILGTRFLTCGVNGYGTRQELIKTSRHMDILPKPKLIIVGYLGANDADDDELFPHYGVLSGYRVPTWQKCPSSGECLIMEPEQNLKSKLKLFFGRSSVIYNLFYRVYAGILSRETDQTDNKKLTEVISETHKKSIEGFAGLAAKHNVKVLFVLIPSKNEVGLDFNDKIRNDHIKEILSSNGIVYLDLRQDFSDSVDASGSKLYWDFDGHWNVAGNRLAGLLVSEYILKNNLVDITDKSVVLDIIVTSLKKEFSIYRQEDN